MDFNNITLMGICNTSQIPPFQRFSALINKIKMNITWNAIACHSIFRAMVYGGIVFSFVHIYMIIKSPPYQSFACIAGLISTLDSIKIGFSRLAQCEYKIHRIVLGLIASTNILLGIRCDMASVRKSDLKVK